MNWWTFNHSLTLSLPPSSLLPPPSSSTFHSSSTFLLYFPLLSAFHSLKITLVNRILWDNTSPRRLLHPYLACPSHPTTTRALYGVSSPNLPSPSSIPEEFRLYSSRSASPGRPFIYSLIQSFSHSFSPLFVLPSSLPSTFPIHTRQAPWPPPPWAPTQRSMSSPWKAEPVAVAEKVIKRAELGKVKLLLSSPPARTFPVCPAHTDPSRLRTDGPQAPKSTRPRPIQDRPRLGRPPPRQH
jgi:hypothetical protein